MADKRPKNGKGRKKAAPKDDSTDDDWMLRDMRRVLLDIMNISIDPPREEKE